MNIRMPLPALSLPARDIFDVADSDAMDAGRAAHTSFAEVQRQSAPRANGGADAALREIDMRTRQDLDALPEAESHDASCNRFAAASSVTWGPELRKLCQCHGPAPAA